MKFEKEIKEFKKLLSSSNDFREIWNYFSENFARNDSFFDLGKEIKSKKIKSLITLAGEKLLQKKVTVSNLAIANIKKFNFSHGACAIDNKFGAFFYFNDINIGLLSLMGNPLKNEISFVRLTAIISGDPAAFDDDVSLDEASKVIIPPVSKKLQ